MAIALYYRSYAASLYHDVEETIYSDVWDSPACNSLVENPANSVRPGHNTRENNGFAVSRGVFFFDTSGLPDDAVISSAYIRLRIQVDSSYTLVLQNGQPTYPHNPAEAGDYLQSQYSGNGGELAPSASGNRYLNLNEDGISWINKEGITKFVFRIQDEIDASEPSGTESVWIDNTNTYKPYIYIVYEVPIATVTTQDATEIDYDCAMGNGTIVSDTNASERGFEIVLDFSGTLNDYVQHRIAGFLGDITFSSASNWSGTLTKTETETGSLAEGAYELVLGVASVLGNPSAVFSDKLFRCETYTYRAYAIIDDETYYGDYVEFSTLCPDGQQDEDGNPTVPIIPIEPDEPYPPFEWDPDLPEPYPPWDWTPPEWDLPDYPPSSFVGDFYYHKPYTKKDLDELRQKCIIYNKNSVEFAIVLWHNMNVLREFFNMMTDYLDAEEFNDFTDIIPPQRLKELYLDPLEVNDFKDMINGFIRSTVDNNIAVNRNFGLIQEGLSDYENESDDAYFREIYSSMKIVTEDNPDVDTLKRIIDNLNNETRDNFGTIMHNLEILRARLL